MQEIIIQGRIVRGHPGVKKPVIDDITKKQKVNERGEPRESIYFGVAVEKSIFNTQCWPAFYNEALAAFPSGIPQSFAYKFVDGDGVDSEGKPYSRHEGYAGHFVINYSTEGFPPPVYKTKPSNPNDFDQIPVENVNCGDYVAVSTSLKYNGNSGTRKPGLYVNPQCLIHLGFGNKIVSASVDPKEKFANFQAMQFAGMSQQPAMPSVMPMAMSAPVTQAPAAMPMATPAHDFVQNAVGQAPAPMPMAAAPQQYAAAPMPMAAAPQQYAAAPMPMAAAPQQYAAAPMPMGMPGAPTGR
jgi:hypothetical protein